MSPPSGEVRTGSCGGRPHTWAGEVTGTLRMASARWMGRGPMCVILHALMLASEAGDTSLLGQAWVDRGRQEKARVESGFLIT